MKENRVCFSARRDKILANSILAKNMSDKFIKIIRIFKTVFESIILRWFWISFVSWVRPAQAFFKVKMETGQVSAG